MKILSKNIIGFCIVFFFGISNAFAFGTINSLGQHAEHEKITRLGLSGLGIGHKTLDEIAGKRGTYGAVGAPDRLSRGLMSVSAAHCDNGDWLRSKGYRQSHKDAKSKLVECRQWIFRWLNKAVELADQLVDKNGRVTKRGRIAEFSCKFDGKRGSVKCRILGAMGVAYHAAQDFYSHTNWTDVQVRGVIGSKNPPGLGHNTPAPWLNPARRVKMPEGLISGCFGGVPEFAFCRGRVRHSVLNKDKGKIDVKSGSIGRGKTKRGKVNGNFSRAVKAAIKDTRAKWQYFESKLVQKYGSSRGKLMICLIRRDDPGSCGL